MTFSMIWPSLQAGLLIFALRIVDITFYTLRVMMVARGYKAQAALFAFFQSAAFVTAIRSVLTSLDQPYIIAGYAAGFATGLVVGMTIEARLAIGYSHLRIISPGRGAEICRRLREQGYAVTEMPGRGRDGTVTILSCSVMRRYADQVTRIVEGADTASFITVENVRSVQRGFWRR